MPLLLLFGEPTTVLSFVDAQNDPLPAGLQVTVVSQADGSSFTQYLAVGAQVTCVLHDGVTYSASFAGTNAPSTPAVFVATGGNQTVVVAGYASPDPTQVGYARLQTQLWPRDWFDDAARASGGIAYNLAMGLGAEYADLYVQVQSDILNARLQSSTGINIDLWVQDFFGPYLPRNPGETDAQYIARTMANLQAKRGTPQGVITVSSYYGPTSIIEPFLAAQTGALGSPSLAFGSPQGAIGSMTPAPQVYVHPTRTLTSPLTDQIESQIIAARPLGINVSSFQTDPSMAPSPNPFGGTVNADGSWTNVDAHASSAQYPQVSGQPFVARVAIASALDNLAPNSDTFSGWTFSGLTQGSGGPNGCADLEYIGTGSAATFQTLQSPAIAVTPGEVLAFSAWIDPSHISNLSAKLIVADATLATWYGSTSVTSGVAGRYSVTLTVPAGVTQVYLGFDVYNCTVASGQLLKFSQPMLENKAVASAQYISSGTGIIIGTGTNGYKLSLDASGSLQLLKIGSGLATLLTSTSHAADSAYHVYRLSVTPGNIISASLDGVALPMQSDSSIALSGSMPVTIFTNGSSGSAKMFFASGSATAL